MGINVQQIKSGNMKCFEEVYHQYKAKLYYYVLKYTQSPYLAEEAVQLTFIKCWENRQQLSSDLEFSMQIFRIAKSIMIDLIRKEGNFSKQMILAAQEAGETYEETDITYKDELYRVHAIIESMPPTRRTIFKLSRFQDLTHKEIADRLSISSKTVENQIGRALRQLKDKLLMLF